MRNVSLILGLVLSCLIFVGCPAETESSSEKERKETEKLMNDMNASVGMPSITNYQEKRWAKMIFELRDKSDLVTYAYITNMHGDLIYLGRCVGYGLPYSVQYTSPDKIAEERLNYGYAILPQADPNGLYMPDGLSATWLMMLGPDGEVKPVYVEQEIIVSPFPLHKEK